MKLVGYVRVSSESQEENTSLVNQRDRIEAFCAAFGHELVKVFEEVGSGKDIESRPVFQEALEMVRAEADGVIALKLDRIARNTRDVLTLVEDTLQPMDKSLVLLDLQIDTSNPTGKMILTVMAAVAELERNTINERTQGGRAAKARAGGYAYGSPAFGQKAVDGELIADPKEAEVVEIILKHHRAGKSYERIAQYLNSQEIPTKRGKKWSSMQVFRICKRIFR